MSHPDRDSSTSPSTRHRRTALIIVLATLTIVTVTIVGVSMSHKDVAVTPTTDSTHDDPAAIAATPVPAVTTAPGDLDEKTAQSLLTTFVTTAAAIPPDSTDVSAQIGAIAGEDLIEELEATLLELHANGWTRTGSPTIASSSIIDRDDSGDTPIVTVEACIDSGKVRTLDSAGEELPTDPEAARALNLYTLGQQHDGSWMLLSRTFPADPSC